MMLVDDAMPGAHSAELAAAQVFHPNIDLDGNICLNILREDWKPVLSINSVIYGLQFLFLVCAVPPSHPWQYLQCLPWQRSAS